MSNYLFKISKVIFEDYGLGNGKMLAAFIVSTVASILALIGFWFPPFTAAICALLPLLMAGGIFIGVSLATNLNPAGMFLGLIAGALAATFTYILSSSLIYFAPIILVCLTIPNVLAGTAFLLGGILSCIEECWSCFPSRNKNTDCYTSTYQARNVPTDDSYSSPLSSGYNSQSTKNYYQPTHYQSIYQQSGNRYSKETARACYASYPIPKCH